MSVEKVGKEFENVGKAGSHGKFKTKAGAEAQKKAMFANGFKVKGSKMEHIKGCMVDHDPRISGCMIHPHADFKAKLHKAVSDAYDAHMQEHGLMDEPHVERTEQE